MEELENAIINMNERSWIYTRVRHAFSLAILDLAFFTGRRPVPTCNSFHCQLTLSYLDLWSSQYDDSQM